MTLNSLYVQFAVLSSLVAARRWRLNAWKKDGARMSMDKIEKQIHTNKEWCESLSLLLRSCVYINFIFN